MKRERTAILGIVTALALILIAAADAPVASASISPWDYFGDCPVDTPAMLSIPSGSGADCVQLVAQGTAWNLGTKRFSGDLFEFFFGAADASTADVIPPRYGVLFGFNGGDQVGLVLPPLQLVDLCYILYPGGGPNWFECEFGPIGGIGGLTYIGPGSIPSAVLGISVVPELAGTPSGFSASALSRTGSQVLTVPIEFQLQNLLLGTKCFVGTNTDPIVLHLKTLAPPTSSTSATDPNGFPVTFTFGYGGTIGDSSFAEPGASGCGPGGALDAIVDKLVGVPRAAGQNSITMPLGREWIAATQAGGQVLSQSYHASLG